MHEFVGGTFATCRDVQPESAMRSILLQNSARFGRGRSNRRCRFLGVKQTHSGHRENDANDRSRLRTCIRYLR